MTQQSEGKKKSVNPGLNENEDVSFCLALMSAGAGLSLLLLLTWVLHCSLKVSKEESKLHCLGPQRECAVP